MNLKKVASLVCACLMLILGAYAAPLPCEKPGTERWKIKTTLPPNPTKQTMTLEQALNLPPHKEIKKDEKEYDAARITSPPPEENTMITLTGYLYLVAFESDDCDFHIQLTTQPLTGPPTKEDNSMIVEVPSGEYATTVSDQVEAVRQFVIDKLLAGQPPKLNSIHVMQHPVHVQVTGALFYDDAHTYEADGSTGRGKKGLESRTLWELHPLTAIAFVK